MQTFVPDQSTATSLLEKILSRKCKIHKQYACEYLHTIPSTFSPRLCCLCIEERNIPASEFVFIKLLLQASTNTTFNAYPKLNDNSISKKLQLYKNTSDQIQEDLQQFFDNLKSTISSAIEKKRSAQKDKLASLQTSYQRIFDSIEQISQVGKLKELIKNDNEEQLQTFIKDQFSRADTYTSKINNNLVEYQKNYQGFSLSDPNNKLQEIVNLIKSIEFFPTNLQSQENNSQQQPSSFQSQLQQQQECLIQEQQQLKRQQEMKQNNIQAQQQQEQEQLNQQQKQQQQQLKQQQQQQHQKEQSTTSQSVYSEYVSLVKRCEDKKTLKKEKKMEKSKEWSWDKWEWKEMEMEEKKEWSWMKMEWEYKWMWRWWKTKEMREEEDQAARKIGLPFQAQRLGAAGLERYAGTYEEWLSFTEEERQKQLSILRKLVRPSN